MIDKDSVDVKTQQIFSYYNIDVLNLGRELELEKSGFYVGHHSGCYISLKNCMLQKVLKGEIISVSNYWNYFIYIKQLRIEDQYEGNVLCQRTN